MKSNRFMQRGFTLTLYLMVSLLVGAQTPKKPRMQTSASPKETIYKSWEDMQAELKTKSTPAKAPAQTGKSNAAKNKTVNKAPKEKKTATPTLSLIHI